MSTHNVFDNNQCPCGPINDPIVDKLLGNAYQVVKYVAMNMPAIKVVSDEIASILAVYAKLKELSDIQAKIPELMEVLAALPHLEVLHTNLVQLLTLYTHIDELVKVATGIDDIHVITPHLQELATVAANITEVVAAGTNITKVIAVANSIASVNKLAPVVAEIDTLAQNVQALVNINANLPELLNINNHLPDLLNIETPLSKLVINSFEALRRTYAEAGLVLVNGSFEEGAKITAHRDVVLERKTGNGYSWQGSIPSGGKIIPAGSTPDSSGGVGVDKWVDVSNTTLRESITTQAKESLRRSYAEAGFNLVDGSFELGGTLINTNDVLLQESTGKAFTGPAGVVPAGTSPASGVFVDRSLITLSSKMIALELNGCIPDFNFSTGSGTDNHTAIVACITRAKALGRSVTSLSGGAFGFSGILDIDAELNLNGATLCQLNKSSDSVVLKKGGQLNNGSLFHNMSTGEALIIDGGSEIFIGRQQANICDNLRVYSTETVQPVSTWVGTGIHLKAGDGQYISGASINATIQGFADGYKETATGNGFINSIFAKLNMNLCKRFVTIDSEIPTKSYTVGESEYSLNIQPQSGAEYAMSLACENSKFTGNVWDAAQFTDVSKVVRLVNKIPPAPNQSFTACRGNSIKMFGVNPDRVSGSLMANTIENPAGNNPSRVTQPFSRKFESNAVLRKVKDGNNGITDSLSFLQVVDNAIAGANARFLVLTTRTNSSGTNLGGISPSSGTVEGMFIGNSTSATFTTTDFATVTVSIKEGPYSKLQMNVDAVGVKFLGNVTDIIVEVRQAGASQWSVAYEAFNIDRDFVAVRLNPFGGSTNVVSTVLIDGVRVRARSAAGFVTIENIFCMSPDEKGKDFVDANDAIVTKGNLVFVTSSQGPQLVDTITGEKYRIAVSNGAVVATKML